MLVRFPFSPCPPIPETDLARPATLKLEKLKPCVGGGASDTGVWTLAATNGQGPSPRFSLAGDVVDMEKGILMFLGGCNEHLEALDDMYYFYTGLLSLHN